MNNGKLQFICMTATNYMSFKNLNFSFEEGLHIVLGQNHDSDKAQSNGSGKSSLVELLGLIGYGIFEREDPAMNGKGNFEGEMEFRRGGVHYKVQRYFHHKKHKNKALIWVDGVDVTPVRAAEANEKILNALGMSYELFTHTVVILQNLLTSFTMLTPTVRKSMIEDMIGSTFYAEYQQRFNGKSKSITIVKQDVDTKVAETELSYTAKQAEYETSKRLMGEVMADGRGEVAKAEAELVAEQNTLSLIAVPSQTELLRIHNDLTKAKSELLGQSQLYASLSESLNNKKCRYCGAEVTAAKISEIELQLNAAATAKSKAEALVQQLSPLYATEYAAYQAEISKLATQRERVQNCLNSVSKAKAKLAESETKVDLIAIETEIAAIKTNYTELVQRQAELRHNLDIAQYLSKLMLPSSPFRSFVIERYLGFINEILAEISPTILEGIVISLGMDAKEGVEISMVRSDGTWISYKNLSGGEKRRADAVFILAFQRFIAEVTGAGSNVLFLDEITEGVDAVGVENIVQAVSELFEGSCVYMISHSDDIKNLFDRSITVHKKDGCSTIEESK